VRGQNTTNHNQLARIRQWSNQPAAMNSTCHYIFSSYMRLTLSFLLPLSSEGNRMRRMRGLATIYEPHPDLNSPPTLWMLQGMGREWKGDGTIGFNKHPTPKHVGKALLRCVELREGTYWREGVTRQLNYNESGERKVKSESILGCPRGPMTIRWLTQGRKGCQMCELEV